MEIKKQVTEDKVILELSGRLDTTTAPALELAISELNPKTPLEMDLKGLEYVSSAGLRVFLITKKLFGANLTVLNKQESVREVFDITGFTRMLEAKK